MEYNQEMEEKEDRSKGGFVKGIGIGFVSGVFLAAVICVSVVLIYSVVSGKYLILGKRGVVSEAKSELLDQETVEKIDQLAEYIDLYYYDEFTEDDIRKSLISGVMEGVGDPYSVYYTMRDYKDLKISTSGTYYGIGAGLQQDKDTMVVHISKVYSGTPSEEVGLQKDDIILYVDDVDATSMELSKLVERIRGEDGTSVHLQVYRESTKETLDFDVRRKNVELPSVEGQILSDGMGYIQISEFQEKTPDQFHKILIELEKQGMKGLIVDVRSNPGGLLNSVVDILDELLPKGIVVYTQDKYGYRQNYESDPSCVDYPIVVLADGNSASAAEIFTGAIKDYEYGTIIGTKTFGKGIVQSIFPLEDGDAIKLTTAKYFTPKGNYIHGVGIEPDVELEYEFTGPKDAAYEIRYDNQLQKAIEIMAGKID